MRNPRTQVRSDNDVMIGERRSWMMFVDGENFCLRGQEVANAANVQMTVGPLFKPDTLLWIPGLNALAIPNGNHAYLAGIGTRSYYYASIQGDENVIEDLEDTLWGWGFTPRVFKKNKRAKAKGVDIMLAKDMLSHAFLDHYDAACLFAGDGDYVPLVEEVKRLGKRVICCFFRDSGLNPRLRRSCDEFIDMGPTLIGKWQYFLRSGKS